MATRTLQLPSNPCATSTYITTTAKLSEVNTAAATVATYRIRKAN